MILGNYRLQDLQRQAGFLKSSLYDTIREAGLDLRLDADLVMEPKQFKLAQTVEEVDLRFDRIRTQLIGFCNLRSTWARRGLLIPPTIVDPGFRGRLVIEVFNASDAQIIIPKGERFLHLILAECDGAIPYQGQYQNQLLNTPISD